MLVIIIVAGAIVGLETSPTLVAQYGPIFHLLDQLVLAAFTIELVLNFASYGRSPMQFFKDGWNIFDLFVVIACALPYFLPPDAFHTHFFAVLRLARVLRVLKLAEQFEELQLIINALFNSIPSLFYVFLLLVMYFYIYAVLGVDFFQKDCEEFDSIPAALLTLFRIVTFDDWAALMKDLMKQHNAVGVALYFVSFILFGAMIFLNLFIGIITSELAELREARQAMALKKHLPASPHSSDTDLAAMEAMLDRQLSEMALLKVQLAQLRATLNPPFSAPEATVSSTAKSSQNRE